MIVLLQLKSRLWIKRLTYRSRSGRLFSLVSLSCLVFILTTIALPELYRLSLYLLQRSPYGAGQFITRIDLWDQPHFERQLIIKDPARISVYRIAPRLKLIGLGRAIETLPDGGQVLSIKLFSNAPKDLPRRNASLKVRVGPPSISLYLSEIINGPRGEQIRASLHQLWSELKLGSQEIWPPLRQELSQQLKKRGLGQLTSDPYVQQTIHAYLGHEIRSHVRLPDTLNRVKESKEFISLWRLIEGGIDLETASSKALEASLKGGVEQLSQLPGKLREVAPDDHLFIGSLLCLTNPSNNLSSDGIRGDSSRLLGGLLRLAFGEANPNICRAYQQSITTTLISGARSGAEELGKQTWTHLTRNQDQALQRGGALGQRLVSEFQVGPIFRGLVTQLSNDLQLREYLRSHYGDQALAGLKESLLHVSRSSQLEERMHQLQNSISQLFTSMMVALFLDEEKRGPHPLLITLVQEQLNRRKQPVVWVTLGNDPHSAPHNYLFNRAPLEQGVH